MLPKMVTTNKLTEEFNKLVVTEKKDRSEYFKTRVICQVCYASCLRHHLNRHQKSKRCMFVRGVKLSLKLHKWKIGRIR